MPEEIKGLLRAMVQEQAETRALVEALDGDVKGLTKSADKVADAQHRSVWERRAIVVVLLTSIALVSLYILDALQRRAEFRQQLRDLACLAVQRTPPGVSGTADDIRHKYDCPPFVASASSPGPTSTVTASGRPGRTVTAHTTATATVAAPGPTRTVSLAGPTRTIQARPRTLVRTVTATRTVTRCQVPLLPCAGMTTDRQRGKD